MADEAPLLVTEHDVKDSNLLLRFLRKIIARFTAVGSRLDSLEKQPPIPSFAKIASELQAQGSAPLNVNNLLGETAQLQRAKAVRYSTAPSGLVLQQLQDQQLILIGSSSTGFSLQSVTGGNPTTLYNLISGLSSSNFITLDTTQTVTTGGIKTVDAVWTISSNAPWVVQGAWTVSTGGAWTINGAWTWTVSQSALSTVDANLIWTVKNTNSTGTSAAAFLQTVGDAVSLKHISHGSGQTAVRCGVTLGGWGEIFETGGTGLLIDTNGTEPIVFGLNSTEMGRFSNTGWTLTTASPAFFNGAITSTSLTVGGALTASKGGIFSGQPVTITAGLEVGKLSVTSTPVTITESNTYVYVNNGAATTVNLPAAPSNGEVHWICDDSGNALVNNITVSGNGKNISGAGSQTINTNNGAIRVAYNGTQWNLF